MRLSIRCLIAILAILLLSLNYGCAQNTKPDCVLVQIESAGTYCLEPFRVIAVSPAPHNHPKNIALDVIITSPVASTDVNYNDVFRIILSSDARTKPEPVCRQWQSILGERKLNCSVSIPGKQLKLIVTFDDDKALGRFEERTQIIADDVVNNVIKEWTPRKNDNRRKR